MLGSDTSSLLLIYLNCNCRIRDALPESPSAGQGFTVGSSQSMQGHIAALQTLKQHARFREAALLSLLAMLGGVMLVNRGGAASVGGNFVGQRQSSTLLVKLVIGLSLANGVLAFLLQARDGWLLWNTSHISD